MMFWDQEALSAPHTQRELDMIGTENKYDLSFTDEFKAMYNEAVAADTTTTKEIHALRVKLDRAQSEVGRLEQELAEARQREEDAVSQHDTLRDQRDAEKALADRAIPYASCFARCAIEAGDDTCTCGHYELRSAYRKARGL